MGVTCKPVGEFKSIMCKLDNALNLRPGRRFDLLKERQEKPETKKRRK